MDDPDIFALERAFPEPHELFSFKIPPLESVKDSCDVVIDTNVLLLPYGTDSKNLSEIRRFYEKLKSEERLFIPERFAREFVRNRTRKVLDLTKALANKRSRWVEQATATSYPFLEGLTAYAELRKVEAKIQSQINPYKAAVGKLIDVINEWGWNDPVTTIYQDIFTKEVVKGHGLEDDVIAADLKYRATNKIPPGYKDGNKEDSGVGDLLIWMTILDIGKSRNKPLVFVSGDEKADWFHRSDNRGILPRYELVDEFRRASSGSAFYIASFSELLRLFGVPQEVVLAVEEEERETGLESTDRMGRSHHLVVSRVALRDNASQNPREAIKSCWKILSRAILWSANFDLDGASPDSVPVSDALNRLASSPAYPIETIDVLRSLQSAAIRVFNQSEYGYSPSVAEALDYVSNCLDSAIILKRISARWSFSVME